jgi:thiol-disulfide isomerase/thioredoxin
MLHGIFREGVLLETISVGPVAFASETLLLAGAILVALGTATVGERQSGVNAKPQVWLVVITGLLAARLAFVAAHFPLYVASPWAFFALKDGGYDRMIGLGVTIMLAAFIAWRSPARRKPLRIAVAAGLATFIVGSAIVTMLAPPPMHLPALTFKRLEGGTVNLGELKGRPVVVNLWASWCPPCRNEMPVLRDAQAQHEDVVFVFVDQGEDDATARAYLASQQLALRNVAMDPQRELARQVGSQVLPTTLFFDEKGMLAGRRIGELSNVTLAQRIEKLVATASPSHPSEP